MASCTAIENSWYLPYPVEGDSDEYDEGAPCRYDGVHPEVGWTVLCNEIRSSA